jgi:lipid-binding SYLF domain-containing protein
MKTQKLSKLFFSMAISCLCFVQAKSQEKQEDKIIATTQVLKDFGNMKESIPSELLKATEGIIVIPKLINGGFVLAAKRGKGIAMVKLPDGPGAILYL